MPGGAEDPRHTTWVIGAGGLLGGSLATRLRRRGDQVVAPPIPWSSPHGSVSALAAAAGAFADAAARAGRPWRVAWCAGAGVTGTAAGLLEDEVAAFRSLLEALTVQTPRPSALFVASSAGGLYAGAPAPPFTESHPVVPVSAYGQAKRQQEELAREFAESTRVPTVVGRIANLYGPGQDLTKAQGLVSHVCRSYLTGQPISIYVPLDTVRDYLYVDDCAGLVADALDTVESVAPTTSVLKILASQQGTTIGALLGDCHRVLKRMPRVVLGTSSTAKFQARDLRLRSTVWTHLDGRALTPLPVGIRATCAGLLRSMQRGALA